MKIIIWTLIIILWSYQSGTGMEKNNMNFEEFTGIEFLYLDIETLSGNRILYPDSVKGEVTLIIIAFQRQTQSKIDTFHYQV